VEYRYTPPPLPSFARLRTLYRDAPRDSVLRNLEFEALATKRLQGRVLDVGGGRKARYLARLPAGLELESVNIDAAIEPTYLIAPGAAFPVADARFDGVVSFNTLEHIYDTRFVLDEILRVLKPGASAHLSVPFIFRIHAHPDDYFRATPSWWAETLRRVGFAQVEIMPLVWGRYTTARMVLGHRGLIPARWRDFLDHAKDIAYAAAMFRGETRYVGAKGARVCGVSPGWFISAMKAAGNR
jgi:SAM-dependent methyltransferase